MPEKIDGIVLVPKPSRDYLSERQLIDYQDRRRKLIQWSLNIGETQRRQKDTLLPQCDSASTGSINSTGDRAYCRRLSTPLGGVDQSERSASDDGLYRTLRGGGYNRLMPSR